MNKGGRNGHKSKGVNYHTPIESRTTSVLHTQYAEIAGFSKQSEHYETATIVKHKISSELLKRRENITHPLFT